MKTVAELIKFLETVEPELPVRIIYDGYNERLFIFKDGGHLCFSNRPMTTECEDAEVLFTSEAPRGMP